MSSAKQGGTARSTIYHRLRSEIITGCRQPGERLCIDALKQAFGTSITPVRDALQMLSQEKLVTIKPRSGYYVTHITLKDLHDMMDFREILELAAVERAVTHIAPEEIVALATLHAGYTGDDVTSCTRYTDENRDFHYRIALGSGNKELAGQLGHLLDRMARFMVIRQPGKELASLHAPLVSALKQRDVQGARAAIQKELADTRRHIMDRIMEREAASWQLGAFSDAVAPA